MRVLRIKPKVYITGVLTFMVILLLSWKHRTDFNFVYWFFGPNNIRQADLDYFAQAIQLNYSVRENSLDNGMLYEAEIILTNNGRQSFPWKNWSIIFCQPYKAEPEHYPYPQGFEKKESGIRIFSLQGGVYRIEPMDNVLSDITPGQSRSIRFVSKYFNIAITDNFPNWYFAVTGLEPRIIESTRGESYDWVGKYDTPNLWKRTDDPADDQYDLYDPFTPQQRFDQHSVKNLNTAPLLVIPTPIHVENHDPSKKANVLDGIWHVVADPLFHEEKEYVLDLWEMHSGISPWKKRCIILINEEVKVTAQGRELPTDESYELRVVAKTKIITIKASKPAGIFYGIQTLISVTDKKGNVSEVVIRDAPRYPYRGFMLDVARNFHPKEEIFRYIDLMAMYKLNKLHLHLTDDEGWRLAIPGLPELTELGASRCHDLTETKCLLPFLGSGPFVGPPGSGFYTLEDYRSILRYAAVHHIEVIPEIDMPGHSHAAIKAMDLRRRRYMDVNVTEASRFLLQDLQDKSHYESVQGFINNAINPCLQSTYSFISRVLNSLYVMHQGVNPLKMFHFGGDEVAKNAWNKSPVCQRLIHNSVNIPLADYLAIQISNMTSLYNLDLAGWEDGMMEAKVPFKRDALKNKNVYAFVWNNVWEWGNARRAYDFANNGYKIVLTPSTNLYFDHPHEPDPKERGLYWASRYTDALQMYSFTPENIYQNALTTRNGAKSNICMKDDCPKLERRENIAGIQGTLFGELLRTEWITDYMIAPRILALAERAWHEARWETEPDKVKRDDAMMTDWTNFANTVGHKELARLDMLEYAYRIPRPGAKIEDGKLHVSLTFPGLVMEFSQDEGQTWKEIPASYTVSVEKGLKCMVRARSVSGDRYSQIVVIPGIVKGNSGCQLVTSIIQIVTIVLITFQLK